MRMRLLISGSKRNTNTIGAFIIKNFDGSFPFEVLEYPDVFAQLLKSRFYRLVYRLFPILIIRKMDNLFLQQIETFKPTVILIFKGMEISKWSLGRIKGTGVRLVNYNFDHPFDFFARGTGNRFVMEAIPYYDLHISYSSIIARQVSERYNLPTAVIPFGFHLTDDQFDQVMEENRAEIMEVCFVGNPDEMRIMILKKLVASNLHVNVYGFGWEQYMNSSELLTIHIARKAFDFWMEPIEFWKVLRQYRIQLNFFRPHNEGSHNMRTFEVPAVGGILVTPDSREQRLFFESEEEIFFYMDHTSLINQCKKILAMHSNEIEKVRAKARERSVQEDFSYRRRTADLVKILESVNTGDLSFNN